jgi:imidazolonepropionase-like amidohydrolase
VTPGLINSLTELGLIEIDQVRDTKDDTARGTNNVSAAFRVWEGLNSASASFAPTRNEGITTAIITPHGGLVSGQAAVIDLLPGRVADMLRRAPVAMVAQVDSPNDAGTSAQVAGAAG